jgi:membrane protease YdiL (CAAX protease family)
MGMSINKALVIVLFAFLLGIIAGYHREKSGSLAPAIIVHMFANIGGSIAGFLISFYM